MPFCLTKQFADKIKTSIKSGELNPEKLGDIKDSQLRRDFLAKLVGEENAKQVNLLFEQKLLLKNQEKAMYDWANQITGLDKPAREALRVKIQQTLADKKQMITDKQLNEIASDAYSRKYKTEVSLEQSQTITDLAQDAKVAKDKMNPDFTFNSKSDGLDYGAKKRALDNYIGALKIDINKRSLINPLTQQGLGAKVEAMVENAKISANFIFDNSRAIVASMDNSLWFRQGIKGLLDPRFTKGWAENFVQSWKNIYQTIKGNGGTAKDIFLGKDAIKAGDAIKDASLAKTYASKNYLNGRYDGKVGEGPAGTKLDIGTGEESFPTSAPSRIPILGRFFKGSEVAYEVGAMEMRKTFADKAYVWAEKAGKDMTSNKVVGEINATINEITGRSTFGRRAGGVEKTLNTAFFSVKFFKSNVDYLTSPVRWALDPTSAGKQLAAKNLLYTAAVTGVILKLAQTLNPNDNKDIFNPTSSNFGKIRNGNMTVDITGGAGGLVVLASKIINQKSTSSTTGITTKLGSGYGSQTGMDVLWSFTENKFSPAAGVIRDLIKQQTFAGGKPTIQSEVGGLVTPILIGNISQFKSEGQAKQILGLIADGLGLNTNVFTSSTDWGQNTGVELKQFQQKVGDTKFKQANDTYNKQYDSWLVSAKKNPTYQKLSSEDKQKLITKKKGEIKDKIFKSYNFKYKSAPTKKLPKL